jgi:hypothetical protein
VITEYVHQELNREVTAVGGHYVLVKESKLPFRGREILYLVGHAAFETTCCGVGGCAYALVPGFVLQWKHRTNEHGLAVSQVVAIRDGAIKRDVWCLVERREVVHQILFQ